MTKEQFIKLRQKSFITRFVSGAVAILILFILQGDYSPFRRGETIGSIIMNLVYTFLPLGLIVGHTYSKTRLIIGNIVALLGFILGVILYIY